MALRSPAIPMSGAALATLIQGRLAGLINDEEFAAAKAHLAAESAGLPLHGRRHSGLGA